MCEAWDHAIQPIIHAQSLWPKWTKFHPYQKGDLVWLEGTNLHMSHPTSKLRPKRFGPYKIINELSPVTYCLNLPLKWKIHSAFHVSLLSPSHEMSKHRINYSSLAPDLVNGEPEWEVEKILDSHHYGQNQQLQYLVKWVGYPDLDNSWEPTMHL
jgi:hypothetical protein